MIRTVLVDDSTETLEALTIQYALHPEIQLVGTAATSSKALALCASQEVNLVSIDIRLGRENGLYLCKTIRNLHPQIFVAICTIEDHEENRFNARQVGAHYFLSKPISRVDLIDMILCYHLGTQEGLMDDVPSE